MKQKYILKIGLVIIVTFAILGTSYTPSADFNYRKPIHRALLFGRDFDKTGYLHGFMVFEEALLSNGYTENNIIILYEENATRENFSNAFDTFQTRCKGSDTLLIVIGSHGTEAYKPPDMGGFSTADGKIDWDELDENISKVKCAGVGIIIEACYSNSAHWAVSGLKKDGRVLFTGNCNNPYLIHSAAHAFLGLADYGRFGDGNGAVTMDEAFDFVNDSRSDREPGFWSGYPVQGENNQKPLYVTFQNWEEGRIDQILDTPFTTPFGPYSEMELVFDHPSYPSNDEERAAQKFKPNMPKLIKVLINMAPSKTHTPSEGEDFRVSIQENLNSMQPIVSKTLPYSSFITDYGKITSNYHTFDFEDVVD